MIARIGALRIGAVALILGITSQPSWTQSPPTPQPEAELRDEVHQIRDLLRTQTELLELQRRQIDRQQAEIDELRSKLGLAPAAQPASHPGDHTLELASAVDAIRISAPTIRDGGALASEETGLTKPIRS